jgi:O-antigen/teichoic acid export membrane protein
MALSLVQTVVVLRILSGTEYGVLGAITTFVTNVNRLFSFRMGEVIVKYMGEYLARDEKDRAAAILKLAMLSEAITSLVTFLMLVIIAPLGRCCLLKMPATAHYLFYLGFPFSEISSTNHRPVFCRSAGIFAARPPSISAAVY